MNAKNDMAWPSIARITGECGFKSERTTQKFLGLLCDEGWLTREGQSDRRTTRYRAAIPDQIVKPDPAPDAPRMKCTRHSVSFDPAPDAPELNNRTKQVFISTKFKILWDEFPNDLGAKGVKSKALDQFKKLPLDQPLFDQIMAGLAAQVEQKRAAKSEGRFFESFQHVERWIKYRRWGDELPEEADPDFLEYIR